MEVRFGQPNTYGATLGEVRGLGGGLNNGIPNTNLFGTDEPTSDFGIDGQLYIQDVEFQEQPVIWVFANGDWHKLKTSDVDFIADEFSEDEHYSIYDVVFYDGKLYYSRTTQSGAWDENKWQPINSIADRVNANSDKITNHDFSIKAVEADVAALNEDIAKLEEEIAPNFDASKTYNLNDQVRYNGKLYVFTTYHTGAWNDAHVYQFDSLSQPISSLSNMASRNHNDIADIKTEQTEQNEAISNVSKAQQIDRKMIKSIVGDWYEEEKIDSFANEVDVPSNAYPFAELQMVGGMSRKGNQLLDTSKASTRGIAKIVGGEIVLNGTTSAQEDFYFFDTGNVALAPIKSLNENVIIHCNDFKVGIWKTSGTVSGNQLTINPMADNLVSIYLIVPAGTYSNKVVSIMVERGTTAHAYEPYTPSLIDAKVEEVVSVGNGYKKLTEVQKTWLTNNENIWKRKDTTVVYTNTNSLNIYKADSFMYIYQNGDIQTWTAITPTGLEIYYGRYVGAEYLYAKHDNLNYDHLWEVTKLIPQAIIDLCPDYGIGVNQNCFNYIDFVEKKYHKRVGVVDLGSLNWARTTTVQGKYRFYSTGLVGSIMPPSSLSTVANVLTAKYETISGQAPNEGIVGVGIHTNGNVIVFDSSFADSDTTAFKTAMNGVMLYYELATEEIIDLSSVWIDDLDILEVEANGTVKFSYENDDIYSVDVPSTILYQEKA